MVDENFIENNLNSFTNFLLFSFNGVDLSMYNAKIILHNIKNISCSFNCAHSYFLELEYIRPQIYYHPN